MASSATKTSSTPSSDTSEDSDSIFAVKENKAAEILPENTESPPWRAPPQTGARPGSQHIVRKESCNEQLQEEEEFFRAPNAPLHPPQKQQLSISPAPCRNSAGKDTQNQQEVHQQDQPLNMEDDSSYSSVRSMPPPLWTQAFSKGVTDFVKSTVDGIISQGSLQHAPKRKFWSSLTSQDIFRAPLQSSANEEAEEDDDLLGSGSFSNVTKVHIKGKGDGNNNSLFAMKRLKGDLLPSKLTEQSCKNGSVIAFTKAATELAREAFLLSRFNHPHIINIMGWTDGGVTSYFTYRRHDAYFLVLELLQEENLDDRIEGWNRDDGHLQTTACTPDKIKAYFHRRKIEQLTICKQVASALAYIHSKNVVYRDLKPQNIGFSREVDTEGDSSECNIVVKIMDFGLARELPSNGGTLSPSSPFPEQANKFGPRTSHKQPPALFDMTGTVGTIRYMAPEVCLNRPYGLECDIYSWSIVAHEILTQTKPYDDMTPDLYQSIVCQQGVRPPTQNLPSEHTVLLTQAWRTDPSKRSSINRIQRQLDLFLQQEQLMWEARELLSDMPEKSESPIFLSQSYSDENIGTRHCSHQGGGQAKKRSWYRANNPDSITNETPRKNTIFPNASMECHGENSARKGYSRSNHCYNHNYDYDNVYDYDEHHSTTTHHTFMYEQRPQQQQGKFGTKSLSPSSRLPEPVTPDRKFMKQKDQQRSHQRNIQNDYNSNDYSYNDYNYNYNYNGNDYHSNDHYNRHNGAGIHSGHLSPSHDYHRQWAGGYY